MSNEAVIILLAVVITGIAIAFFILWRMKKRPETADMFQQQLLEINRQMTEMQKQQTDVPRILSEGQVKNLETINKQLTSMVDVFNQNINSLRNSMHEQLTKTQGNISQQLEGTTKVVSDVRQKLGELSETAKNMQELGKDINKLQDILKPPKLRGNIGELFLEDLLRQVLPTKNYTIQHSFKSGERVDAVIRLGDNLVPIDSKFPLDSFNRIEKAEVEADKKNAKKDFVRDLKNLINDISKKYIRPDEGTYDFAMMYIPAENVFYEVIIKDDAFVEEKGLLSYALEKHVVPVSPNSFYAYLMAIAYGLRGMHIEKQAQEIRGKLVDLQQGFGRFFDVFNSLGKNIDMASRKFDEASKKAERFHDNLSLITGKTIQIEEDRTCLDEKEVSKD
ncbi:MAG: DNA recombination protein RmuC [Nitrospirota bacterium]